ncbi:MAG: DNA polymerase III subunit gamma/tau [bacterium]
MAYQVLARKWRPQRFADVIGQEHVTTTLVNAIRTERLAHAFLFCGPRGVGKTTTARILAKCLNCEKATNGPVEEPCNECGTCREIGAGTSLDVLEIDGASNRGIDEIRDLRENVRYAPSGGRAKVYIIDEVHMLTKEAFNALLKTLEEPPPDVYFVFATTEVHKVPATIRSRCQRYDFRRIDTVTIEETLARLAEREGFEAEPEAIAELARQAEGGLRDAESLLDQAAAIGGGKVTEDGVRSLLGEAEDEIYLAIVSACAEGRTVDAFTRLSELLDRGMDPARVALSLTQTLRDLLVAAEAGEAAGALGVRPDRAEEYRRLASGVSGAKLTALLALASRTVADLRRSARPRLALEVALARMARLEDPGEMAELARRLDALTSGLPVPPPSAPAPSAPPAAPTARTPSRPTAPAPTADTEPGRAASRSARADAPKGSSARRSRPAGDEPRAMGGSGGSGGAVPETASFEGPSAEEWESGVATAEMPPPPEEAMFTERPAAVPPAATVVSGEAGRLWDSLLARLRTRKRMLASFLEHGAPGALDEESFCAVFDNTYYEGMVQRRENLAVIQEELESAAGRKLRFRVRTGQVPIAPGTGSADPGAAPRGPRDLLDDNPGLRRIVRDLDGQILPGGDSAGS